VSLALGGNCNSLKLSYFLLSHAWDMILCFRYPWVMKSDHSMVVWKKIQNTKSGKKNHPCRSWYKLQTGTPLISACWWCCGQYLWYKQIKPRQIATFLFKKSKQIPKETFSLSCVLYRFNRPPNLAIKQVQISFFRYGKFNYKTGVVWWFGENGIPCYLLRKHTSTVWQLCISTCSYLQCSVLRC
jgi:hypothetical protein